MTSTTHGADFRRALGVIPPFAVAGALSTLPFVLQADDMADAMWRLGPPAAISAGLVGWLMWALLVGHRPERWRPPTAGALAGVLAHPPMWAMVSLVVGQEVGMAPAEQATGAFVSAALFSVFSMIIYGPLTVLAGALVGWLLGRTGLAPGVQPRPATHPR